LEQTREEPQKATEEESSLRNRCVFLEEKQIQKKEQIELLEVQVSELQVELGDERDGLKGELHHLKSQQYKAVKEAQEQANRLVVDQQAEEEKAGALKEHTRVLTRCIEAMQSSIQIKEEEAKQLRISLQQPREEEAEKVEAVKVQRGILEEHNKEMQREKSRVQALQHKVLELKTRMQELESERCAQQREQESLAVICRSLKEEHQAELCSCLPAEALKTLRALREQLEHLIIHLHQELGSQKQTTEQLRKDKERELCAQRQQLRVERDRALDSVKERLIQEHIEELSSLNRTQLTDGGAEEGGAAGSLRKQLKAKDVELRQVQRSMAQWKQQTAARLACKFEEELTAELERCKAKLIRGRKISVAQGEGQRKSERPEGGKAPSGKDAQTLVGSPSLHAVDPAASHSPSDVASFKLLRYLQSRVKQLRLENQAYTWNSSPPDSGSYLRGVSTFFYWQSASGS
ncbi:unnamed protein product, partial [Pleuronectes platessa]